MNESNDDRQSAGEPEVVLETIDLARDFDGRVALNDVSLTVARGEVLALLGPNGVGKSTLMKLIAGLLKPSHGEARLWGSPCWPPSANLCRVGCVLDGMAPSAGVRVRDLLSLKQSATPTFDRALADSLCREHRIGLTSRWHTLSKGQKRWVLLAATLASGVELLLLDEPADGLDVATRRELYGLLRRQANQRGVTVVVASHVITDLERIADEVVILADGKVRLHSPLEQLRDEVWEVELGRDFSESAVTPLAEITSSRRTDEGTLAVIRFRSPHLADHLLPGEVARRRVSLEDLYLAYTLPAVVDQRLDPSVV